MRLTVVRHGESVANREGRWQGQGDAPLSELGREQVRAVGARLRSRSFDHVISSDLTRAHDTARAASDRVETDARWREFDVGAWEGLTREEVQQRYPEELAALTSGEDVPLGGGETHSSFAERIGAALADLTERVEADARVLLVCHGGVIGSLLGGVLGLARHGHWPFTRVRNTSITEFEVRASGPGGLLAFNDAAHLHVEPDTGFLETQGAHVVALRADADGEPPAGWVGDLAGHDHHDARGPGELDALLASLARDAGRRVGASLPAQSVAEWASATIWPRQSTGYVATPVAGAICHVFMRGSQTALLDYNVHPER